MKLLRWEKEGWKRYRQRRYIVRGSSIALGGYIREKRYCQRKNKMIEWHGCSDQKRNERKYIDLAGATSILIASSLDIRTAWTLLASIALDAFQRILLERMTSTKGLAVTWYQSWNSCSAHMNTTSCSSHRWEQIDGIPTFGTYNLPASGIGIDQSAGRCQMIDLSFPE